ncbi:nucleotidyltransferase domain-containing protein [Paenibacillus spongiae]|uniref:Nucleotidyltransferase family protein n=1 Tax=Paenibacillus spongiae TaxID=2909671 RepID=A0ABY5SGK2_9BACL|nr:nucleotidyltransferase family protein [Paenibacillus spongiae]UVI31620.1 nucleotidyltransferase family protein [Paenibacillus spongiae]
MADEFNLPVSALPRELLLLIRLLRMDDDAGSSAFSSDDFRDVDWALFLRLGSHHRVYPLLYLHLKRLNSVHVPARVMNSLQAAYNKNTFHMLHLTAEMERVSRLLEEHRIRSLVLKGPVLAEALYGSLSHRTSKDLDILIPENKLEEAERVLIASGYRQDHEVPRVLNDLKMKTHHVSYTHPEKEVQIEIHWRLNPSTVAEPAFDELWNRRRSSAISGFPVYFLGSEDLFYYLTSHGARHGWFRLRWLADMDRLIRSPLHAASLLKLMQQHEGIHIGGQAVLLASQLFMTPIPEPLRPLTSGGHSRRLARRALFIIKDVTNLQSSKDVNTHYKGYIFAMMSNRQRWRYMAERLYPSSLDTALLPLPKPLHFLYFPLRPFLWFWRRMKHQANS